MVDQIKQIASFIRLGNLVLITIYFFVVDAFVLEPVRLQLGLDPALSRVEFFLLIVDVLLVTILGYWMNDWSDREADRLNRPKRFMVQNDIKTGDVLTLIGLPALLATGITLYLGFKTDNEPWMALFPVVLILLTWYARKGKSRGFIGNILVSLLIATLPLLLIIAEWQLLVSLYASMHASAIALIEVLFIFSGLMFFSNLGREVIKDCEDMEGDQVLDSASLPLTKGIQFSKWVIMGALLMAIALEINFLVFSTVKPISQFLAGGIVLGLAIAILSALRAKNISAFKTSSSLLKVIMFAGIIQLAVYMLMDYSSIN